MQLIFHTGVYPVWKHSNNQNDSPYWKTLISNPPSWKMDRIFRVLVRISALFSLISRQILRHWSYRLMIMEGIFNSVLMDLFLCLSLPHQMSLRNWPLNNFFTDWPNSSIHPAYLVYFSSSLKISLILIPIRVPTNLNVQSRSINNVKRRMDSFAGCSK